MNAKQAFERIGYVQIRDDDDYIIYQKPIDGKTDTKEVNFCDQLRSFQVVFESGRQMPSIDMELFKAITLQLTELGWLG